MVPHRQSHYNHVILCMYLCLKWTASQSETDALVVVADDSTWEVFLKRTVDTGTSGEVGVQH